jgi:hypothetical protein
MSSSSADVDRAANAHTSVNDVPIASVNRPLTFAAKVMSLVVGERKMGEFRPAQNSSRGGGDLVAARPGASPVPDQPAVDVAMDAAAQAPASAVAPAPVPVPAPAPVIGSRVGVDAAAVPGGIVVGAAVAPVHLPPNNDNNRLVPANANDGFAAAVAAPGVDAAAPAPASPVPIAAAALAPKVSAQEEKKEQHLKPAVPVSIASIPASAVSAFEADAHMADAIPAAHAAPACGGDDVMGQDGRAADDDAEDGAGAGVDPDAGVGADAGADADAGAAVPVPGSTSPRDAPAANNSADPKVASARHKVDIAAAGSKAASAGKKRQRTQEVDSLKESSGFNGQEIAPRCSHAGGEIYPDSGGLDGGKLSHIRSLCKKGGLFKLGESAAEGTDGASRAGAASKRKAAAAAAADTVTNVVSKKQRSESTGSESTDATPAASASAAASVAAPAAAPTSAPTVSGVKEAEADEDDEEEVENVEPGNYVVIQTTTLGWIGSARKTKTIQTYALVKSVMPKDLEVYWIYSAKNLKFERILGKTTKVRLARCNFGDNDLAQCDFVQSIPRQGLLRKVKPPLIKFTLSQSGPSFQLKRKAPQA